VGLFYYEQLTDNLIMRRLAVTITLVFFSLQQVVLASADFPREANSQKALRLCAHSVELECIESLQVIYANGKSSNLILSRAATGTSQDEYGQINENAVSDWIYLDSQSIKKNVTISATLSPENYKSPAYKKPYPSMWFIFSGLSKEEVKSGIKFQVAIRSSWLNPQGVGLMSANAEFLQEKKSYGFKYVFTGSPFWSTSFNSPEKFQQLNTLNQDDTKSDGEFAQLYFVLDHRSSIPGGSFWGDTCSDFGYSITSHNAIGAGQPYMSDNETLRFNIGAPHLLSTGEITEGFFTTDIPIAYINCRWPQNTLTKSPKIEVVVTNSDGTNQVATTAITLEKGVLKVRAFGFHYSQPTIVVRASTNSDVAVLSDVNINKSKASPVAVKTKKLTITCVKGQKTKKVSAIKPVCPIGYKKR
jgi:hypothetical protein